jgi:hypothetical protein
MDLYDIVVLALSRTLTLNSLPFSISKPRRFKLLPRDNAKRSNYQVTSTLTSGRETKQTQNFNFTVTMIVPIPLIRSFTRSGIATTTLGKTIESARIEAIRTDRQFRVLSISNSHGLFTLQGLRVGKYRLEINGK